MLGKITLMIVGFVAVGTNAQEDSLFSLFKRQQKPQIPSYKPPKVDGDLERWRDQTNRQFRNCDSNNSGFITRAEYSVCSPYSNNWDSLVAQFDTNRDGLLSWNEVYQAVKQHDDHNTVALVERDESDDLDEKMNSLTFLWDNIQSNDDTSLMSFITARD